jgi:hypothetical protein
VRGQKTSMTIEFKPSQVWRFETRQHEQDAFLTILAVREDPALGTICSISISGIALVNPRADSGFQSQLLHVPITAKVLEQNVAELIATNGPTAAHPDFALPYYQWLVPFEKGDAGVFTLSPAEIISAIEEAASGAIEKR